MCRILLPLLLFATALGMQTWAQRPDATDQQVKNSAAYAEVLLRKTEVSADMEAFGADYTDANPKMIELKAELASLERSQARLLAMKPPQVARLTQALGRLMVRKAAYESDLARFSWTYNKDHAEVRRAQRRVDHFEAAINELLK